MSNNKGSKEILNVIFIIPTSEAGGIETYLLRFLKLYSYSFKCSVLVLNSKRGGLDKDYKNIEGVSIIYHPLGYYKLSNFFWLFKFLKKNRFDVVCDFNGNFAGITLSIAKFAKISKRIAQYRRSSDAFKPTFLNITYNGMVNRLVRNTATDVVSNSQTALDYFFKGIWRHDDRFKVIQNGIPSTNNRFDTIKKESMLNSLGIEPKTLVIGHVGRYDPSKNHDTILKVAQIFKDDYKDLKVKFVLCGVGTDDDVFKSKVNNQGLNGIILLLGQRFDVQDLLACFDVFYFPSLTEGQPNALLEAMSIGLPIVASDIAPIREILPTHFHSQLVSPMDAELASKGIHKILASKNSYDFKKLKVWCSDRYNYENNMKAFYQLLISN